MVKSVFRRLLPLFLVLVILLSVLPTSAHAAYNEDITQLLAGSMASGESVDIRQFNLTADELHKYFLYTYNHSAIRPWYHTYNYSYNINRTTNTVTFFHPRYRDETEYNRTSYELRVAEILDAALHEGMSDWQIALALHDYIIVNGAYDETYTYYAGYDMAVRETSVCQGYAELYMDLLLRAGIPCVIVMSSDMNHAWNMVQIGGNWYHVDATWDDPISDTYGQVLHTYFLVTDAEMEADHKKRQKDGTSGHYNWECAYTSTDTSLKKAFWKNVNSQICFASAKTCYLRRESKGNHYIYRRNNETGKETKLYTLKKSFINIGRSSKYNYGYIGGLSLWNGRLYFGSLNKVYSMNLKGKDVKTVYSHKTASKKTYIYSTYVENDVLYIELRTHKFKASEATKELSASGYHVHSYDCVETPATCTQAGTAVYTCSCGIQVQAQGAAATGHTYTLAKEVPVTCTEDGYNLYVCHCGDSYTETTEWAYGHDFTYSYVDPTCTQSGYDIYACHCGYEEVYESFPSTGHYYRRYTDIRNGYNKAGRDRYTCQDCGDTYYVDTPALTFLEWISGK